MNKLLKFENLSILGALAGLLIGLTLPGVALSISIFGDIFLTLLKLIIIPLIFLSVFLAVARQRDVSKLSHLGLKTLFFFIASTGLACLTGFAAGMIIPRAEKSSIAYEAYKETAMRSVDVSEMILGFFSSNFFKSLTEGNIIQIVVVALFMGLAFLQITESKKERLLETLEAFDEIVMVLVKWILYLAPIGILSLVATITAKTDSSIFAGLGWMFLAIAVGLCLHIFVTLSAMGFFLGGFNPYRFILNMKEVLIVATATASSNATLPVSTRVLEEKENVDPETSGFVLPLGATINMDGSSLYQTLIILYLGDLAGIQFTMMNQVYIFFLILVSSVGTAGIPGGGLLMIGAVMQNVGVPLEYLGIYLIIDRFWDPPVTMVNVLGDLFGAKIIDQVNKKKVQALKPLRE